MKWDAPKAPTALHGSLGIKCHLKYKAVVIADCLEIHFTSQEMYDENHERHVQTTVQALLSSVDATPLEKIRPCDINNVANSLKMRKALEMMLFKTNALGFFQEH
jgi:hypothetical protein